MKHVMGLRGIMENDMLPPDGWLMNEWQALDDLGFEADGNFKMSFDHEDEIDGDVKTLNMVVYKKKDGWYVETTKNGKMEQCLRFNRHESLLTKIHDTFKNF
jgi:hypothetical protein